MSTTEPGALTGAPRLYQRLVRADRSDQSPDDQVRTARNGLRHVVADALQGSGDQVVSARTVLPWLLTSLGAPGVLLGLLVPVRESLSMLPQAALAPRVRRRRRRRGVWVAGALGQAGAAVAMALAAATLEGLAAGLAVVTALVVFSLSRSLCSLAGKDVLGRTVPKGERGQISGLTTVVSGAVAITLGLGIRVLGGDEVSPAFLAVLLAAAATTWLLGAVVFGGIAEPADDPPADEQGAGWVRAAVDTLRADAGFRRFVLTRALLLVSALSPPFVVALAASGPGDAVLSGLGPFVIAQGVANLVGGRFFGRAADRSSRRLMTRAALAASLTVVALLVALSVPGVREQAWIYPVVYLVLAVTHTGARVARKTYVVDLAGDDRRTQYIAVSNSAMGVLLLVVGAVSGVLAGFGHELALGFLAAVGLVGVAVSRSLPEVSRR